MEKYVLMFLFAICWAPVYANGEVLDLIIDGQHTHIIWQVDRFEFTDTVGSFKDIKGKISLDEDNLENSQIQAEINVNKVQSDSTEREEVIKGEYWLNASQFPKINFTSTKISEHTDKKKCHKRCFQVTGDLTVKGVTKPVVLNGVLNKIGIDPVSRNQAAGFTLSGQLSRSDFGVSIAKGFIGDEVKFEVYVLGVVAASEKAEKAEKAEQ